MWGSVLGSVASGVGSVLGGIANTAYSSHEQRNNAAISDERQWYYYNRQKELDYKYDELYNKVDKDYYRFQQDLAYEYAQKYAENSAKWSVTGLENAGLNPIIAAQNGNFSNIQNHTSPSNARHVATSGLTSHQANVNSSLFNNSLVDSVVQGAKLGDELRQLDVDTKLKQGTLDSNVQSAKADVLLKTAEASRVDALTQSAKADSAVKLAEADKVAAEAENERRYGGSRGPTADVRRTVGSLTDRIVDSFSDAKDSGVIQDATNRIVNDVKRVTDSVSSTAKSVGSSVGSKLRSAFHAIRKFGSRSSERKYNGFGVPSF